MSDQQQSSAWPVALFTITFVLLLATALAWAGADQGARYQGWSVFALAGLVCYGIQWVMFVHAWITHSERLYDLVGSITFVTVVMGALVLVDRFDVRSLVLAALVIIWAGRLGPFLYRRIKKAGEDRRFRSIRTSFPTFLMTWTLQGTWVFVTASCAVAAITSSRVVGADIYLGVGLVIWLVGFTLEVLADAQKSAFRSDPDNAHTFIREGLWAWSRHPNYFGEIVLWCGVAVIAYPALVGWQLATLGSPLFIVVLLVFVSGARMLESRAQRLWGEDPEYQAYKRDTPLLVPWPPKG